MTQQTADGLAGDWYRQYVAAREAEPGDAIGWNVAIMDAEAVLRGREELPDDVLADAERFLADRGLCLPPLSRDKFFAALEREYLAAATTLCRRAQGDRGRDDHLDRLEPLPTSPPSKLLAPNGRQAAKVASRSGGAELAVALIEAYAADRGVAEATLRRWQPVMLELDTQAWSEPSWDAQAWIDSLITPARSQGTVKRAWLAACNTVFRWAKLRKKVATNPFADVVVSVRKKVVNRETGRGFNDTEAQTILQAASAAPTQPTGTAGYERLASRRWIPWLLAYTGARSGEMAQLRVCDVDLTRMAIVITPDAGTVKTGKARVVPINEHLIEQGFLGYVKDVLASSRNGSGAWVSTIQASARTMRGGIRSRPRLDGTASTRVSGTPSADIPRALWPRSMSM
jgi:site-specific recombinase XerD